MSSLNQDPWTLAVAVQVSSFGLGRVIRVCDIWQGPILRGQMRDLTRAKALRIERLLRSFECVPLPGPRGEWEVTKNPLA